MRPARKWYAFPTLVRGGSSSGQGYLNVEESHQRANENIYKSSPFLTSLAITQ